MFCLSTEPKHLNTIKEFSYLPVGLGEMQNFLMIGLLIIKEKTFQ